MRLHGEVELLARWKSGAVVLATGYDSYTMRRYAEPTDPAWPQRVLDLLVDEVWQPTAPTPWRDGFRERFRIDPPEWIDTAPFRTHGDPTMCNVLVDEGRPVWIDPIPPGYGIPELRGVDAGKVMQSLAGWEVLRGTGDVVWEWPARWPCSVEDAAWWLSIHCRRIRLRSAPGCADWEWADLVRRRMEELLWSYGLL